MYSSIYCVGQRIAKFVFQSETGVIGALKIKQNANSGDINNNIVNISSKTSFMWTVNETQDNSPASTGFRLTIVDNFVCKSQELIAIIGKVGSGKSLFINSLLGETCCTGASMYVENGIKALVPQSAWILNCSVRDNIIFDNPFDLNIYNNVLQACQLTVDIKSFAELDQTMIGERG